MKYLQAVETSRTDVETELKDLVKEGYDHIVTTRRNLQKDRGSFVTKTGDKDGSLKFTAKVVKLLNLVKPWNYGSNDDYIVQGLNFLKKQQKGDGHWESDEMKSENIENQLDQNVFSTAYVAIAFLENEPYKERFANQIEKALNFIKEHIGEVTDPQALAMSAYALSFETFEDSEMCLEKLDKLSIKTDGEKVQGWNYNNDVEVEIASYVLLAYEKMKRVEKSKNVLDWLLSQRRKDGTFSTIEGTNMGIKALAAVSKHLHTVSTNIKVELDNERDKKSTIVQDNSPETEFNLHGPEGVSVNLNGNGVAYVQCHQSYKIKPANLELNEDFEIIVDPKPEENNAKLEVCVANRSRQKKTINVPHVIQVQLPSGYEFERYEEQQPFKKVIYP